MNREVNNQIIFFILIISFISALGCVSLTPDEGEKIHSITINADEYTAPLIFTALNNTDLSISRYIKSINVVPSDILNSMCPQKNNGYMESVGCSNRSFFSNQLDHADIYLAYLDEFNDYYSFNFTLYHEIGHVDHSKKVGFLNDSFQSSIIREKYADEYAYIYALECNIDVYTDITKKLQETEDKLNEQAKNHSYDEQYEALLVELDKLLTKQTLCINQTKIDEKLYRNRTQKIYFYNLK
ncbi:MAG: hypothetical protein MPEBLZ_01819 [Candidatus Methanoperedens nitroreducens]|uniref:Uncharacterized protein n=1 Tax=Candidatus Methanoperedens nitratireducens TaxID=1392998 RepID=A0A0P8A672_9EURY|nr:hypothetical protein [Candidatus Methanoperedens sp. BLZ2]KAB2948437.1 MAG: hypothetical protein F9K14_01000 [Candidatus Methanoperedens sp.]KPQ43635.1 MAG: hypothetical protein MPEBLZ_01819 [Candidatus Methanoperedens sp. BLZ1]MBZ0174471.1 hypothetical protein [Candidatus Methanoperedens nitroreducens]MCX9078493.1 hypothetical protein [Candidatus Methanoperedens sp.]